MKILYEDKYIAVCEKDAGMLSEGDGENCLPYMIASHLKEIGSPNTQVFPVHRLDRETVGVMVFALTKESAANLSEQIRLGTFEKEYIALCHGVPEKRDGTLKDLLYYDRRRGKSFVVDKARAGVKEASLEYYVLEATNGISKLKIKLHTGRTHQIRIQFASRKHPLAGDRRYGAPKDSYKTVALAAHKLSFNHPKSNERMTFEAALPEWMNIRGLG